MKIVKKVISIFLAISFILTLMPFNLVYADSEDGWVYVGCPQYTTSSVVNSKGTAPIIQRLKNSYSYKNRMPLIANRNWRQDKFYPHIANPNRDYSLTTYCSSSHGDGYTQWYDSEYGLFLDYESNNLLNNRVIEDDAIQYNNVCFPNKSNTAYIASDTPDTQIADAKAASVAGSSYNNGKPSDKYYPIFFNNDKDLSNDTLNAVKNIGASNLIILGGNGRFNETAGLSSGYNIIRIGGINRDYTAQYLKNMPNKINNPNHYNANYDNGIVVQGINDNDLLNSVLTRLRNESTKQDGSNLVAAAENIMSYNIRATSLSNSVPNSDSSPKVVIGINSDFYEAYWIGYYYNNVGNNSKEYVYQYVLNNYFKKNAGLQFLDSNKNPINSVTMELGTSGNYYVKAINKGNITWNEYPDNFRLGTDGTTFYNQPSRYTLNNNVSRNETYLFPVTLNATKTGDYNLHYQMIEDSVNDWFGDKLDVPVHVIDKTGPSLTAHVENVTSNGYDVIATAIDPSGIDRVQFPTWTDYHGQDDLADNWQTNTIVKGTPIGNDQYKFHVYRSEHNGEYGHYNTDVYAYDKFGNYASVHTDATLIGLPNLTCSIKLYTSDGSYVNSLIPDQNYTIDVVVNNDTDVTSGPCKLKITGSQGNISTTVNQPTIYGHQNWEYKITNIVPQSSWDSLEVNAYTDCNNEVAETNENDNTDDKTFNMSNYDAQLQLFDSNNNEVTSIRIQQGTTAKYTLKATNIGSKDWLYVPGDGNTDPNKYDPAAPYSKYRINSDGTTFNNVSGVFDIDETIAYAGHDSEYGNENSMEFDTEITLTASQLGDYYLQYQVENKAGMGIPIFMSGPKTKFGKILKIPVVVYQIPSGPPVANFTVNSPIRTNGKLVYNDTSYTKDNWDSISERKWQWSTDEYFSKDVHDGQPSGYDLSQFAADINCNSYFIREKVKNQSGLWSDWCIRNVNVYRINTKPTANFSVNDVIKIGSVLTYKDNSSSNDAWDSIYNEIWQWSTDESFSKNVHDGQPTSFDMNDLPSTYSCGTYFIRLKVIDTGNTNYADYDSECKSKESDWCVKKVVVYKENTAPTANFTVDNSVKVNQTLTYKDTSTSNDAWDSISERKWQWSTDENFSKNVHDGQPTSFDMSEFPSNVAYGTYYIRLKVIDTGNINFVNYDNECKAKESDWCTQSITVYRDSHIPVTNFTVNSPIVVNGILNYSDTSYVTDSWKSITRRIWQWSTDKNFINNVHDGKPTSFDMSEFSSNDKSGNYYIREIVEDSDGLWSSEWCYRNVIVYRENTAPTANFTMQNQILTGDNIIYSDTSTSNDAWDSISERKWQWSTDENFSKNVHDGQPTSFDMSEYPANVAYGTYYVRLKVIDTGNINFVNYDNECKAKESDWCIQPVTVYRRNTKPIAKFTVTNPVLINQIITYTDLSSSCDDWDELIKYEWSYSSDNKANDDLTKVWSSPSNTPPVSFSKAGKYQIRLVVTDKGNLLSPSLVSDPYIIDVIVADMSVKGFVNHTDVWNKKRLDYNSLNPIKQRAENVFWSGEDFMLTANTSYTAYSVSVNIEGTSFSTYLSETSSNVWTGELWDRSMIYWPNKTVNFIFTAYYNIEGNLFTRTDIVPVIIENDGGYWMQHREF